MSESQHITGSIGSIGEKPGGCFVFKKIVETFYLLCSAATSDPRVHYFTFQSNRQDLGSSWSAKGLSLISHVLIKVHSKSRSSPTVRGGPPPPRLVCGGPPPPLCGRGRHAPRGEDTPSMEGVPLCTVCRDQFPRRY